MYLLLIAPLLEYAVFSWKGVVFPSEISKGLVIIWNGYVPEECLLTVVGQNSSIMCFPGHLNWWLKKWEVKGMGSWCDTIPWGMVDFHSTFLRKWNWKERKNFQMFYQVYVFKSSMFMFHLHWIMHLRLIMYKAQECIWALSFEACNSCFLELM